MCWPCMSYSVGLLLPVSGLDAFLEYAFIFQQPAVIVLWFAGWRENERCGFQSGQIPRSWGRIFYPLRREGKLLSGRYLMWKNVYVCFEREFKFKCIPWIKEMKATLYWWRLKLKQIFLKWHYFQRSSLKMLKKLLISQCKRNVSVPFSASAVIVNMV